MDMNSPATGRKQTLKHTMKKTILTLTAAVLALLAGVSAAAQEAEDFDAQYATDLLKPGEKAPDFTIGDLDRKDVTFSSVTKGKYVVLDFWASWCPDCRKDMPKMKELYEKYGNKVVFVGVSLDTDAEKWTKYVSDNGLDWIQLSELKKWKKETTVPDAYNVNWIPSTYIIDKKGKIVLGTVMIEKIEAKLAEISK